MSVTVAPGATVEASYQGATAGTTVFIRVVDTPSGSTFLARTSTGVVNNPVGSKLYFYTFTAPTTAGTYALIWDEGTTGSPTAMEDLVVTSSIAGGGAPAGSDLCTVADVRLALETPSPVTGRDSLIQAMITEASYAIMRHCDREFAPVTTSATRRFQVTRPGCGTPYVYVRPYDLRSVTAVVLHPEDASPTTLTTSDYILGPLPARDGVYSHVNLARNVSLFSTTLQVFGYAQCDVTGAWGFASVPYEVKSACVDTVASWVNKMVLTHGTNAGEDPMLPVGAWMLPMKAKQKLAAFRRPVV